MSGIDYAANFKAFMDDKAKDEPFCFWFGCYEPHRAYSYGLSVTEGAKNLATSIVFQLNGR